MKRLLYLVSILVIFVVCIKSFSLGNTNLDNEVKEKKEEEVKQVSEEEIIDNQVKSMTLEEKIGQMLIMEYDNKVMSEEDKNDIITYQPGGVILFTKNIGTYQEVIDFIDNIKNNSKIMPFISIDQEGGLVQRIKNMKDINIHTIPPMGKIAELKDKKLVSDVGTIIGRELSVFGINMDFAPVIDVLDSYDNKIIGNRSFGVDAEVVGEYGTLISNSLINEGVIPVYKHYPGHGGVSSDSHSELPILYKNKEELLNSDLIPYKMAIQNNAKAIMVGHIAVPNIDSDYKPASLSKILIKDLLINELGFNGVVISDALNMGAITNNYSEKETYELAINAGVNILLMPKSAGSAVELIKQSIEEGTIKEEEIDNSVKKIIKLKREIITERKDASVLEEESYKELVNRTLDKIKE